MKRLHNILMFLLYALISAIGTFAFLTVIQQSDKHLLITPPLVILGYYFSITIHELGHWLAGKVAGFKTVFLQIGPCRIEIRNDRTIVSFSWRLGVDGGLTLMHLGEPPNLRRRMIFYIAAGPIASLFLAFLSASAFLLTTPTFYSPISIFAFFTALSAALHFVITIIPHEIRQTRSDGAALVQLIFDKKRWEYHLSNIQLTNFLTSGVDFRDIPESLIRKLLDFAKSDTEIFRGHATAYNHYMAHKNFDTARGHLECLLKNLGDDSFTQQLYQLEAAFFHAKVDDNAEEARKWQKKVGKFIRVNPFIPCLVEAEILRAEGKKQAALIEFEKARSLAGKDKRIPPHYPLNEVFDELKSRIECTDDKAINI